MRKLLGDERTSLAMLALMFGLAAVNWPLLPDELPIHWSSADEPDSYAPRAFALLFLLVLVTAGAVVGPRADRPFLRAVAERSGSPVTGYLANAH